MKTLVDWGKIDDHLSDTRFTSIRRFTVVCAPQMEAEIASKLPRLEEMHVLEFARERPHYWRYWSGLELGLRPMLKM